MSEETRRIKQGDRSIYVEHGNVIVNYGTKQVRKYLGMPPFIPEVFFGREDDLDEVHDKLFSGNNLLLLVNGEGGIGKTTLASRYYHQYCHEYTHLAWVFANTGIQDAMLNLAIPLHLQFNETSSAQERLGELLCVMTELKKPCLLVIDNANDLHDLESHCDALHACPNFHLLLTTRITEFSQAKAHSVGHLDEENAKKLFTTFYPSHIKEEDDLLQELLQAVGWNTLVIELLAKSLNYINRLKQKYSLSQLLEDLKQKGLFGLSYSREVETKYQSKGSLRKEKPEAIISAMYSMEALEASENVLMSVFAVLPAEEIAFSIIEVLLPGIDALEEILLRLYQKGWIAFNEKMKSFKSSPVIQEVVKKLNSDVLVEHCQLLRDSLIEKLAYATGTGHLENTSYSMGAVYTRYAESVLTNSSGSDDSKGMLLDRIGNFYEITGDLAKALSYFEQFKQFSEELYKLYPENVSFKNSLGISFVKLGKIQTALGDLPKALSSYEQSNQFFAGLHTLHPENVFYKNNLAISYQRLGHIHRELGNLPKALSSYEQSTHFSKELHTLHPENVFYKNNLAISNEKLGNTHTSLGDLGKALSYYEKYKQLIEELHEKYPENVSYKYVLAISNEKLGNTHTSLGDLPNALIYYEQYIQLIDELYKSYPENVDFKKSLAISNEKLGNTYTSLGDLPNALKYFEDDTRLFEELHEKYPENVDFKNGLAISYSKLGSFFKEKTTDNLKARDYLEKAETIWSELVTSNSAFAEYHRNLLWVRNEIQLLE